MVFIRLTTPNRPDDELYVNADKIIIIRRNVKSSHPETSVVLTDEVDFPVNQTPYEIISQIKSEIRRQEQSVVIGSDS